MALTHLFYDGGLKITATPFPKSRGDANFYRMLPQKEIENAF
jgi:hypothetical protein